MKAASIVFICRLKSHRLGNSIDEGGVDYGNGLYYTSAKVFEERGIIG